MSINFATATAEEIEAAFNKLQQEKQELEQQVKTKRTNKTSKLLEDLKLLFTKYTDSTDPLLWLHFLLSVLYNNLEIPVSDLLDELDYAPEDEDIKKVFITENKALIKTDAFKLRKSKKTSVVPVETIEPKEVNTPL